MTELKTRIYALRAEGKSYKQIAQELGCRKSTISYHCNPNTKQKTVLRQRRRYMKMPNKRHINKKLLGQLIGSLLSHKK